METPRNIAAINTNPFSRAFKGLEELFEHNTPWAIIILVFGALGTVTQFIPTDTQPSTDASQVTTNAVSGVGMDGRVVLFIIGFGLIVLFVVAIITTYFEGIIAYVTWKTSKGQKAGFGEAFSAVSRRFWTIFVVEVLISLKIIGGLLLFIVPGIRALLRYEMVLLPVFDENLTATKAMGRVKKLTRKHLMEVSGIATVGTIIPVIGTLLQMGGEAVMYPELKALENHDGPLPKVHWLNYIGFVLIGLLVIAGLGIFALLNTI